MLECHFLRNAISMHPVPTEGPGPRVDATCIDITQVVVSEIELEEHKTAPTQSPRVQDASEGQRRSAADLRRLQEDPAYFENRPKSFLKFFSTPTPQVRDVFGDSIIDYFSLGKHVMLLMMLWTVTSMPILIKRSQQVQAWISANTIPASDDGADGPMIPTVPWMYYVTFSAQNGDLLGWIFGMLAVNLLLALVAPAISYAVQQRRRRERRIPIQANRVPHNPGISASHSNSGTHDVGEVEGTAKIRNDPLPVRRTSAVLSPTPMPVQRHRRILSQPMTQSEIRALDTQSSHAGSIDPDDLPPLPTKLQSVVVVPRPPRPVLQTDNRTHPPSTRTHRYRARERPSHAPSRRDALECTLPEYDEYTAPTQGVVAGSASAVAPIPIHAPMPPRSFANLEYIPGKPWQTRLWRGFSILGTMSMLVCQTTLYIAVTLIDPEEHSWLLLLRSTIFAAAYQIWQASAETLTVWENHKYLHRFRNSFLCKIVVFRVTSTVLLFYLTRFDFVRVFWFGADAATYETHTTGGDCQYITNATQYAVTLASEFASTFVAGVAIPYIQCKAMGWLCRKRVQGNNTWMPSFEIVQETADLEHKKFLVMLAFDSFPLMACGAFFLYVWELAVDRFKLFYLCRPEKRSRTQFKVILVLMNSFSIAVTLAFTLLSIYIGRSDQSNCLFP
jgi:hypothetical protein